MDDLFPTLLILAVLIFLLYLLLGLIIRGARLAGMDTDKALRRAGRFLRQSKLPVLGPILKGIAEREAERQRLAEAERRRRAEAEACERKKRERIQRDYDTLVSRPIPPEIRRDMRAFLLGDFVGEDRSPLAYVGYRVGKTRGLPSKERHSRLDVCFRIEIPSDLDPKYRNWGSPASYQRFLSIERHLKMLADMRRDRANQRFAVADWDADRAWFLKEYKQLADLLRRFSPRRAA